MIIKYVSIDARNNIGFLALAGHSSHIAGNICQEKLLLYIHIYNVCVYEHIASPHQL